MAATAATPCHRTSYTCQAEKQRPSHTAHFPAQDAESLMEAGCANMQLTAYVSLLIEEGQAGNVVGSWAVGRAAWG